MIGNTGAGSTAQFSISGGQLILEREGSKKSPTFEPPKKTAFLSREAVFFLNTKVYLYLNLSGILEIS